MLYTGSLLVSIGVLCALVEVSVCASITKCLRLLFLTSPAMIPCLGLLSNGKVIVTVQMRSEGLL